MILKGLYFLAQLIITTVCIFLISAALGFIFYCMEPSFNTGKQVAADLRSFINFETNPQEEK